MPSRCASWNGAEASAMPSGSALQVHVCRLSCVSVAAERILDRRELDRYQRYHRRDDRERLLLSRLLAKITLGHSLGLDASTITVATDDHGRPSVLQDPRWELSISHSDQVIAVVLSACQRIGIDAEVIDPSTDVLGIARRCFAPAEVSWLHGVSCPLRVQAFHQLWTAKEALAKASGRSLEPVLRMDLSQILRQSSCTVQLPTGDSWRLHDLGVWQGCRLAIACSVAPDDTNSTLPPPPLREWSVRALSAAWRSGPASA
jgi:4'-phosphopantetheinyl transferase